MADDTEKTTTTEKNGHQDVKVFNDRLEVKTALVNLATDVLVRATKQGIKIPTVPKNVDILQLVDNLKNMPNLQLALQTYNLCKLRAYTVKLNYDECYHPKSYQNLLYLSGYSWDKVSITSQEEKAKYLKAIKSKRINNHQQLVSAELVHDFIILCKHIPSLKADSNKAEADNWLLVDTVSSILLIFFDKINVEHYESLLSLEEILRLVKISIKSLQDCITVAYDLVENHPAETFFHVLWEMADKQILQEQTEKKLRKPAPVVPINILEQNYFPLLNIPATQDIAKSAGQLPIQEGILEKLFVKIGDTKINLTDISNADKIIKPSTCKLLDTVVGLFTANNKGQHKKENDQLNTTVCISLDSYCRACGYVKVPKEDELYKTQIDNARKKIHKDLNVLHKATISFKEKGKDFFDRNLISGKGILKGNIIVDLDANFAKILYMAGEMKFHPALLKIDERCSSTFALGRKLCQHYSLDNNVIRGSNKRLSIKVLLETCLDIPRPEDLTNRHWRKRIIEPLEKRLCDLEEAGVLDEWHYCEAKGTPIPNDKITIPTLDYFLNKLYIDFKIKDFNLMDERFIAKQEAKAKRAEAKAKAPRRPRKPKAE